jgi:Skp family chaperone for outer membrane proteins
MKSVFTTLLLLLVYISFSQNPQSEMDKLKSISTDSLTQEIEKSQASLDSSIQAYNRFAEAQARQRDSLSNIRNLEWFMAERREQDRVQKRNLVIRGSLLGTGILLAIAGSIRRRRKAKKDNIA